MWHVTCWKVLGVPKVPFEIFSHLRGHRDGWFHLAHDGGIFFGNDWKTARCESHNQNFYHMDEHGKPEASWKRLQMTTQGDLGCLTPSKCRMTQTTSMTTYFTIRQPTVGSTPIPSVRLGFCQQALSQKHHHWFWQSAAMARNASHGLKMWDCCTWTDVYIAMK